MLFSIVTINYNSEYLEETCKSIVEQSFQDFEWVVVDGGSCKENLDILEKYKYRINKFISEPDNGIYDAMNKGIKLSSGEYLLFMNGGDSFYDSNVLQSFIGNKLDSDIIYSDAYFIDEENNYFQEVKYPDILNETFWITDCICHQATIIKRELFEKYGFYDEENKIISDYEKWLEFQYKYNCSFKHVDFMGAKYYLNGISSNKKTQFIANQEKEKVYKKFFSNKIIMKALVSKYSPIEKIFSIKNHPNMKEKIITLFNIHIIIKRKNKELR